MTELSHWQDIVVSQRYESGCVPTGYEWMIRYLGISGVNLNSFQEDFDLQLRGKGSNSFVPIAEKIKKMYPKVDIKITDFSSGEEKVSFIRGLIKEDIPCVMSIANSPTGGWHIVPVVSIDDTKIKVIWTGNETREFTIAEIVYRHDNWKGGKDVAWIQ